MLFPKWLRPFGLNSQPLNRQNVYRPKLEFLDDRLAPSAGPGWSNVLPVIAPWEFSSPASSKDTSSVATHFEMFTQRETDAGNATTVLVVALDANDRPVKDYTGTVQFASSDGSAILPDDYTFTAGDRGRHAFSLTFNGDGTQSVTATDSTSSDVTGTVSLTVDPAQVATHFYVSIERSAYAESPTRVVVAALDADNRPVSSYTGTVQFSSTDASATLPADYTFTASDRGFKVFTFTPSEAESITLTASDAADPTITGSATSTVNAAPVATHFALLVRPSVAATAATQILVVALDATDRPVQNYTGTVHLTSSDSNATLPADYTFTSADRGVKALSVTFDTSGSQTLTVTDTALTDLTGTATVNVRKLSNLRGGFFGGDKFHWWF